MARVGAGFLQIQDGGLVVLSCLICLLAAQAGAQLLDAHDGPTRRMLSVRAAAILALFGCGFWTADCILLLDLRPERVNLPLCLASFLAATAAGGAPLVCIGARARGLTFAAALLVPALLFMEVCGLCAQLPWQPLAADVSGLATSAFAAAPFALGAMACLRRHARLAAAALLTGAMAAGHFTLLAFAPVPFIDPEATELPLLAAGSLVLTCAASGGGMIVVALGLAMRFHDIRATRRRETERRRMQWLAEAAFEGLILERGGFVIDANQPMCTLLGAVSLTGWRLDSIFSTSVLTSAPLQPSQHELRAPAGVEARRVEVLWRNAPEQEGRVIAVRAVPPERDAQAEIQRVTLFDSQTGLANREQFEYHLRNTLPHPEGLALLYVDLERFESVYDMHGPKVSDEALAQVGRRLILSAPKATLVARLARTEFAVIQPLGDPTVDAEALAASLVAELGRSMDVEGRVISVSAWVGVAIHPAAGETAESLCRGAASALRWAKHEGRARWGVYAPEQDRRLDERQRLEKELSVALSEGQFSVHYQPFFDAQRLELAGCEALLRWDHPARGRISPAEFIPVAEECGLIVEIGKWVLATACAEAARWERNLTIAVNLSPAQFASSRLLDDISAVLRDTDLSPDRLELEITETTVMSDAAHAARIMTALKKMGVSIAMDDFGTGQSSLGNLRKFPFDKIKIDRSFISDEDSDAETIVQTIIAMGRGLRLSITAEGVETRRQLAMLRHHGCTFMQGHLLARPAPVGQLDLEAGRQRRMQAGGASVTALPVKIAAHPV